MKSVIITLLLVSAGLAQVPLPGPIVSTGGTGGGGGTGTVTNIATTSPLSGGPISTTGTISCPTCGVTGSPLSQFATTTSAQLLGVVTDGTGTGSLVFAISPAITTPTISTSAVLTNSALGTSPSGGYTLLNATSAAVGAQQVSPPVLWTGSGWKTAVTAGPQNVTWQAYVLPVQGVNNISAEWRLDANIAALGNLNVLRVVSTGAVAGSQVLLNATNTTGFGAAGSNTMDLIVSAVVNGQLTGSGFFVVKSTGGFEWAGASLAGNPTADTFLTRFAAATIQVGAADATSPIAQTLRFQSQITTANLPGQTAIIQGSAGTGTGVGGDIIFKVARAGSSGASQNTTLTSAFTISGTSGAPVLPSVLFANLAVTPTVGTMVYCTDCVSGTFDATAAGSGTGTPVVYQNGNWKVK